MTTAVEVGEGLASRPGRSLPSGKTRYPLYRRLDAPQGLSGQVRKISSQTGIRSPGRPTHSQSLYRIRYSTHFYLSRQIQIISLHFSSKSLSVIPSSVSLLFVHIQSQVLIVTQSNQNKNCSRLI